MSDLSQTADDLLQLAIDMSRRAHAPYSGFQVGCVIIDDNGNIFTGCNVENASLGLTMCAERVATGTAIANGAQTFKRIIIASSDAVSPCGACRQVLSEFSHKETVITQIDLEGGSRSDHLLESLIPHQFQLRKI